MNIQDVEKAFRLAVQQEQSQPTLAALASNGHLNTGLSDEFVQAMRTLTQRQARAGNSILHNMTSSWT